MEKEKYKEQIAAKDAETVPGKSKAKPVHVSVIQHTSRSSGLGQAKPNNRELFPLDFGYRARNDIVFIDGDNDNNAFARIIRAVGPNTKSIEVFRRKDNPFTKLCGPTYEDAHRRKLITVHEATDTKDGADIKAAYTAGKMLSSMNPLNDFVTILSSDKAFRELRKDLSDDGISCELISLREQIENYSKNGKLLARKAESDLCDVDPKRAKTPNIVDHETVAQDDPLPGTSGWNGKSLTDDVGQPDKDKIEPFDVMPQWFLTHAKKLDDHTDLLQRLLDQQTKIHEMLELLTTQHK